MLRSWSRTKRVPGDLAEEVYPMTSVTHRHGDAWRKVIDSSLCLLVVPVILFAIAVIMNWVAGLL